MILGPACRFGARPAVTPPGHLGPPPPTPSLGVPPRRLAGSSLSRSAPLSRPLPVPGLGVARVSIPLSPDTTALAPEDSNLVPESTRVSTRRIVSRCGRDRESRPMRHALLFALSEPATEVLSAMLRSRSRPIRAQVSERYRLVSFAPVSELDIHESGRRESNPRSQLGKLMFCR